jgi:hypothetical protein
VESRLAVAVALSLVPALSIPAQSTGDSASARSGPRELLQRDWEIALARSAAPASVSDSATVYVLGRDGYEVAVRGSNGIACYVSRSWPASLEPHCHDGEGAATILPMEMRRVELLHRGTAPGAVERDIADGLANGRYRLPRRPAMSWMMSSAQRLIGDDGRPAGAWKPHLMIYFPYLTGSELGLGAEPDPRHAVLVDGGKPTSNLMIVVAEFIDPKGTIPPE